VGGRSPSPDSTGTISASSGYIVNSGATLRLDNTSNNDDRLGNAAAVTLNQGNLAFVGNLAVPTVEAAGTLTISGGANNVLASSTGVGSTASLTFAGLSRTAGVVNFGTAAGTNVVVTAAPNVNGIVGGYATANTNDWATDAGGGVIAAYTGYTTNTAPGTWAATENTNLTAGGTVTVAAPTTINSLRFATANTNLAVAAGQSLNIGTGGILATGTAGASITGAGSLTAGSVAGAELIALVQDAGNTLTISAPITDNGGGAVALVKAGPGKLLLTGTGSTFTGGTSLIGGTLAVGVANYFPTTSNLTLNYNTTFDINGFNQTFGTVNVIDGSLLNSGGGASVTANSFAVQKGLLSAALSGTGSLTKTGAGHRHPQLHQHLQRRQHHQQRNAHHLRQQRAGNRLSHRQRRSHAQRRRHQPDGRHRHPGQLDHFIGQYHRHRHGDRHFI
jgi:autotransporter-associated beta strand protein